MSEADRHKWNRRFREGSHSSLAPSPFLVAQAARLSSRGRALDVAGGPGRNALWLAQRGLEVTVADISPVALAMAAERAEAAGLALELLDTDLERDGLPAGPWEVVVMVLYLQRSLFAALPKVLAPGALVVCIQPTTENLERHPRPARPHLLAPGELGRLATGLEVLQLEESWGEDGYHEARLLARRR